ncbi:hypothetical protein [Aeromonas sp. D3]|uniref:hypothetical protein n=1 Tax=Aeromonas sp. D3 TaxID=2990474 RepID=UPI0022E0F573|nr:hypothetical protein [Aeromonas sp. D3]
MASKPRLTISKIVKHNKLNRYSSDFTSIGFFTLKTKALSHRSSTWQFTEKRAHLLGFKLSSEACKPCIDESTTADVVNSGIGHNHPAHSL